jgi:hypothetical protein
VGSQIFEDWIGAIAIDVNFLHHWEVDIVLLLEIFDFLASSLLLVEELIAWICNDFKTLTFVVSVKIN